MNTPNPTELTGGKWVTKPGGLRVWQPDTEYTDRSQAPTAARMALNILTAIAAGPTFCDCGCWLLNRHETCPACQAQAQEGAA